VLHTGIAWARLPKQMGHDSGMTCWRRLRDWQAAGVWATLHRVLLDRLGVGAAGAAPPVIRTPRWRRRTHHTKTELVNRDSPYGAVRHNARISELGGLPV
jgi:transposase